MANRLTLVLATLLLATPAYAETVDGSRVIIIDGDTVNLPCPAATKGQRGCSERIRLINIDTPEISSVQCEAAYQLGLAAKDVLAELIRGKPVTVRRDGRDRYGRTLAYLSVNGQDIGEALITAGVALRWRPGPKAKAARVREWCGEGR